MGYVSNLSGLEIEVLKYLGGKFRAFGRMAYPALLFGFMGPADVMEERGRAQDVKPGFHDPAYVERRCVHTIDMVRAMTPSFIITVSRCK